MGKRRRRPSEGLDDIGPGLTEQGPVEIVPTGSGAAFFRPAIRPRAWDRLGQEGRDVMAALQACAAHIHEMQGHLAEHVGDARACGMSWDLIGWGVGTSGNAARQRWGGDEL